MVNTVPEKIRGLTHVFTRTSEREQFVEQSYLYPAVKQQQDLFGSAVAVDGEVSLLTCACQYGGGWRFESRKNSAQGTIVFGSHVRIGCALGQIAVVGAKNRDTHVSSKNSGSAMCYKLDFLRFFFVVPDEGSCVWLVASHQLSCFALCSYCRLRLAASSQ